MSEVRVRFAPSPTGPLHIGGVRTALYNYLFAKKHNGKFILRVEDTDQTRFVENAEAYITQSLEWCGLTLDESPTLGGNFGPYKQSERLDLYHQQIPILMQSGFAYYAFDTAEELDVLRKNAEANGQVFTYNSATRNGLNNSLNLAETEVQEKLKTEPYVIRFKMQENRILEMTDLIRGEFSVNTNDLDDKVLVKADGFPTYHFANIIDDHFMEITHVIRGEEWLPSMPLHVLLYEAMHWKAPEFSHLPLILKPEGNGKLSKRDGAKFGFPVFPLNWEESETETYLGFKEAGYLPEALNNILVLLGWSSPSGKEILTLEEMIAEFDLGKVHKSGARFDIDKAKNIQKEFLQKLSTQELTFKYEDALHQQNLDFTNFNTSELVELVKERAIFVEDIIAETLFFFQKPNAFQEKDIQKVWKEDTQEIIEKFLAEIDAMKFTETEIHDALKQFTETHSMGFGKIMMPLRLALVGEMKGPDVPKIMEMLGKEEVKSRLEFLVGKIA